MRSSSSGNESVRPRPALFIVALAFLALGGLEVAFFASDDTYRADGTSNWDAYEDARKMVVAAVVLCAFTAGLATRSGLRHGSALPVALAAALAVTLVFFSWGATLN